MDGNSQHCRDVTPPPTTALHKLIQNCVLFLKVAVKFLNSFIYRDSQIYMEEPKIKNV